MFIVVIILTIFLNINAENLEFRYNGPPMEKLNEIFFSNLKNITSVHIPYATIRTVENHAFNSTPNLKSINLSFNLISELPVGLFSDTVNLEIIVLTNNNINSLEKNLFSNLTNLKFVDLQFNNITFIEEKSFVNLSNLVSINLANNNLKYLSFNITDNVSNLETFYLGGNPWKCDENLCEFMHTIVSKFWQQISVPVCSYPNATQGENWKNVIDFSLPAIIHDVKPNHAVAKVHFRCHTCTKANLSWVYEGQNITEVVRQRVEKFYTISTLTRKAYYDGNYKCIVKNCPYTTCAYASVTLVLKPASAGMRLIVWITVVLIITGVAIYFIFLHGKSRRCRQPSTSTFLLFRKT